MFKEENAMQVDYNSAFNILLTDERPANLQFPHNICNFEARPELGKGEFENMQYFALSTLDSFNFFNFHAIKKKDNRVRLAIFWRIITFMRVSSKKEQQVSADNRMTRTLYLYTRDAQSLFFSSKRLNAYIKRYNTCTTRFVTFHFVFS